MLGIRNRQIEQSVISSDSLGIAAIQESDVRSTKGHGTCCLCLFGSDPSQISPFHIREGASPGTAPSLCRTLGGPSKGPDVSHNKAPGCKDLLGREVL